MLLELSHSLRSIFRNYHRSNGDDTARTSARLEERVVSLVEMMPALPHAAVRAVALANDPDCQMLDFTSLIEKDAAITTAILRVANSAYYAGGMPTAKLQQAVVRLGMRPCQNLIVAIGVRSMFRQVESSTSYQCELLWNHSHIVAALCRRLNRSFRLGFDGEEYSSGLLHDLGRILLALADPESFKLARVMDPEEGENVLARERQAIGIDHCALGAWFAEHSNLPPALTRVIRDHHEPVACQRSADLVTLVAAADHIANHIQRTGDPDAYNPALNLGLFFLWENWSTEKRARLLGDLPEMMEQAIRVAAEEQSVH
jgi:HD-like signal output (HDOD) protein